MTNSNTKFTTLLKRAEDLYFGHSEERYIPAVFAFKDVISEDPSYIEAYSMLSTMYVCLGDYDNALKTYDLAIENIGVIEVIIKGKVRILTKLHRMKYSKPYFVDTYHVDLPYYSINYCNGNQKLIRKQLLVDLEKLIDLETNQDTIYQLKLDKAEVLGKLDQLELAVQANLECLKNIPERKLKSYFNPIAQRYRAISQLYEDKSDFHKALEYLDKAINETTFDYSYRSKINLLTQLGKQKEATRIFETLIATIKKQFVEAPQTAFISQLFSLGQVNNRLDVAEYALALFDKLEPLNDRESEIKNDFVRSLNTHDASKTLSDYFSLQILDAEKLQLQNYRDQWAQEFISWYFELGVSYDTYKLLEGLNSVSKKLGELQFPIAEYHSPSDVLDLLGAVFGEILRREFKWSWRLAKDTENGCVGPLIVSPNNMIGILVKEYIKQNINNNNRDDLQLYNSLQKDINLSANEPIVLGTWKSKYNYEFNIKGGT